KKLQFIFDTFDIDKKVIVIDLFFAEAPEEIIVSNVLKTKGSQKAPLELVSPFFDTCLNLKIPCVISDYGVNWLKPIIDEWEYDFPIISLRGRKSAQKTYTALDTGTMEKLLALYTETVMSNPITNYDRHYINLNFFGNKFFIPEFTIVLTVLFGCSAVFLIFILFKTGHSLKKVNEKTVKKTID
ncbi:MAG: hypothetical protein LBV52_01805, partial [Spirochaetaceae bacterium]|nr:hypothetical protein [Spirochaetaceae bacterium]